MRNIVINKGNILKYGLNINYKSAIVLGAINHIFQSKNFTNFDCVKDEDGVWYGVSHAEIIKEIPILNPSKNTSIYYSNQLIDAGFIERHPNCERLSRTFLKPSQNFRFYFENDESAIILNQNNCICFDKRLTLSHWIVLEIIKKEMKKDFYINFVEINKTNISNSILGIVDDGGGYKKIFKDLIKFDYIVKSERLKNSKVYYYKAGGKFLEYKELQRIII